MDRKIDDGIYLRKGRFGYRLVYPIKREDKTTDWKNVMGLRNKAGLLITFFVIAMICFASFAYYHDTKECFKVLKNPCDFCRNSYIDMPSGLLNLTFNITDLSIPA